MAGLLAEPNNLKRTTTENVNTKTKHMNKLVLAFLFLASFARTQTVIQYDRMETSSTAYAPAGWWTPAATTGWFNNASVTPTLSAVIYGAGNGTSANEQDWYSMPNISGLNSTHSYQLRFRLASYTFSSPTATTRGLDAADIVEVQVSTNGGTYVSELRITGNANAQWPYTATGTITHTANGVWSSLAAPAGDVYQAPAGVTTTGPSTITLNLAAGLTQVAVDIFCRVNSAGEEWWIDNIELWDMTPVLLPVEMTSFTAQYIDGVNVVSWTTASEWNSDYFLIERSITGEFTENSVIGSVKAAGTSNTEMSYTYIDAKFDPAINYYQITQIDVNGEYKVYGPIMVDNRIARKHVVRIIDMMGQPIQENTTNLTRGMYFEIYDLSLIHI
jgi:hypothetical protein